MFAALRKIVFIFVAILDLYSGELKFNFIYFISTVLILIGSLIIGLVDSTKDYFGYIFTMINNVITLIYFIYSRKCRKITKSSHVKLITYNSILILPILFFCIILSKEHLRLIKYYQELDKKLLPGLICFILASCGLTILMNSLYFISNEQNTSLVTQILQHSRDFFAALLNYFMIKNAQIDLISCIGILLSAVGAFFIKMPNICDNYRKKEEKKNEKLLSGQEGRELENMEKN
jgi:solute carrier family 35 protein